MMMGLYIDGLAESTNKTKHAEVTGIEDLGAGGKALGLWSGSSPRISIGPAGCRINRDHAR